MDNNTRERPAEIMDRVRVEGKDELEKISEAQNRVLQNNIESALREGLPFLNDDALNEAAHHINLLVNQHMTILFGRS